MLERLAIISLSCLLLLGGCHAPVAIRPDEVTRVLQPGDRIRVTHASGAETHLVLERVAEDALIGRDGTASVRVPREDWEHVSRMELEWGRTFLVLVAGIVLVVGLAAGAVAGSIMP